MAKKAKIELCTECPFFDYVYYDYMAECDRLDRKIPHDQKYNYIIPDDCPLMDWEVE